MKIKIRFCTFHCTLVGGLPEARDSKFAHLVAAASHCKVKECNEMQLLKCFLWTELATIGI